MCGKTCGRSALEAAASHHGWCSRCSDAGAERRCRFGCISVPLPRSVGPVGSAPVGGGPKAGGHCVTLGTSHQVPRRRFRATLRAGGRGAVPPYPYCCGGRLQTVFGLNPHTYTSKSTRKQNTIRSVDMRVLGEACLIYKRKLQRQTQQETPTPILAQTKLGFAYGKPHTRGFFGCGITVDLARGL